MLASRHFLAGLFFVSSVVCLQISYTVHHLLHTLGNPILMKIFLNLCCSTLLFSLFSFNAPAQASDRQEVPGKVIAGWVERISLPELPITVKAKLDSGAKTSSLHATDIEIFKRDDQRWVRFTVALENAAGETIQQTFEKPRKRRVSIKEHEGDNDSRPVVLMNVCFDGRLHAVQFTLADRSRFIYPVLLGRRFLQKVAVIDPDETYLTQSTCQRVSADSE